MKKFITAALFAITLALSPTAMAEEECWKVGEFADQAKEFGDPIPVQLEEKFVTPMVVAINDALANTPEGGKVNPLWVKDIWYTYTLYRGITPVGVVAMFGDNGCLQGIVAVPLKLLHGVINDPTLGST